MKRIIGFLLILTLSLSVTVAFSSCNDSKEPESSQKTDVDEGLWYSELDFGGQTLNVSQSINTWTTDNSIDNAAKYTRGPAQAGNTDKVLNLCYNRNREVAQLLNVKIKYTETNYRYNEINPYLDTLTMQSQSPFDLIINDVYAVVPAALKGQLYNFKSAEEQNYLNLSHSSWYQEYMNGLTLDENKIYAVAGDYFFSVLRSAHCLYLNTEKFETHLSQSYPTLDDFFDMIASGQWTYDEFNTLINDGFVTTTGNTSATIDDECIGFLCASGAGRFPFGYATDIEMITKDAQGNYIVNQDITDLSTFAESLSSIYENAGTLIANNQGVNFRQVFTEGNVLFLNTYWLGDLEFSSFQAMEKKAPIVYPKWRIEQKNYKTWVHDSAELGYVPVNSANFTAMSAYLQLINEKSVPILSEYYEYTLKFAKNTQPGAVKMIELIHDTITSPFDQFICGQVKSGTFSCSAYGMTCTIGEAINTNVANTFASHKNVFESELRKLVEKFKAMK